MGECDSNPKYMLVNCATSCVAEIKKQKAMKARVEAVQSFYDLQAKDIDGNVVDFGKAFKNKVVVVANVASECGYTDSHYKGMTKLYRDVTRSPDYVRDTFEIVAFPCNQFGKQEPGTPAEIKEFAKTQYNVQFRLMDKVDVNGANADLVYAYLKSVGGVDSITWNFATYFVVDADGNVEAYSGINPQDLKSTILHLLKQKKKTTTTTGESDGEEEEL